MQKGGRVREDLATIVRSSSYPHSSMPLQLWWCREKEININVICQNYIKRFVCVSTSMRKRVGKGRKSSSFLLSVGLLKDDAVVGFIWPCDKVIPECIFLGKEPINL